MKITPVTFACAADFPLLIMSMDIMQPLEGKWFNPRIVIYGDDSHLSNQQLKQLSDRGCFTFKRLNGWGKGVGFGPCLIKRDIWRSLLRLGVLGSADDYVMSVDSDAFVIGEAVFDALKGDHAGIPHDHEYDTPFAANFAHMSGGCNFTRVQILGRAFGSSDDDLLYRVLRDLTRIHIPCSEDVFMSAVFKCHGASFQSLRQFHIADFPRVFETNVFRYNGIVHMTTGSGVHIFDHWISDKRQIPSILKGLGKYPEFPKEALA
jgi:hypothetical protein